VATGPAATPFLKPEPACAGPCQTETPGSCIPLAYRNFSPGKALSSRMKWWNIEGTRSPDVKGRQDSWRIFVYYFKQLHKIGEFLYHAC
jgi:hypothetical protein